MTTNPAYKLALQLAFEAEKNISYFKKLFDGVKDKKRLNHSIIMAAQMLSPNPEAKQKLYKAAYKYLSIPPIDPIDSTQKASRRANKLAKKEGLTGEKNRPAVPTFVSLDIEIRHTISVITNALDGLNDNDGEAIYFAHIGRAISGLLQKLKGIENLHTRYDYISRAKTAINDAFQGQQLDIVSRYTAKLHDDVATRFKKRYYQTKVIHRNKYSLSISQANALVTQAEDEIIRQIGKTKSWAKLAICLSLVTDRRLYEICKLGQFTPKGRDHMIMSGVAKQKNIEDFINKSITFPTLVNSTLVLEGIKSLRDKKDFEQYENYRKFDKSANTPLRKALHDPQGTYQTILNLPNLDIRFTPKMMRQLYAAISKYHFQQQFPRKTDTFYDQKLADILGHNADTDIQTVQSYKDFAVFEDETKEDQNG